MLQHKTIRSILASVMLLVFAFSITPQQIIHDAVAKHLDPTICEVHKDVPLDQIENTRLHCSFDFQVATAPFIYYDFSIQLNAPEQIATAIAFYIATPAAQALQKNTNKGPPSLINTIV